MRRILFAIICVATTHAAFAQSQLPLKYMDLVKQADSLFQRKKYNQAAQSYSAAFSVNGWKGTQEDRYNAARAWAMAGVPDSAFFSLDRLVSRLFFDADEVVQKDEYFNPLHNDPRWQPLLEQIKRNKVPYGWGRAGSKPYSYQMFVDSGAGKEGKNAASIKSIADEEPIAGFGTLMQ